jgi:hypothetical protein
MFFGEDLCCKRLVKAAAVGKRELVNDVQS